jgi:hypothetical protein
VVSTVRGTDPSIVVLVYVEGGGKVRYDVRVSTSGKVRGIFEIETIKI